jgi:protocatechuate 3,4-dioxygenase beta subunit
MQKYACFFIVFIGISACNNTQPASESNVVIGGACQDCEALLDYLKIGKELSNVDTILGYQNDNRKVKISGKVYKKDGKTPASDVILYVYQTNRDGIYQASEQPIGWEKRHGKHRGWMKTQKDGSYAFYTFRPAPYPDNQEPEHIHIYVKEEGKNPYYIDSFLFDDDLLLSQEERSALANRGGSGIIHLEMKNGFLNAYRDIVLGKNIPDYE